MWIPPRSTLQPSSSDCSGAELPLALFLLQIQCCTSSIFPPVSIQWIQIEAASSTWRSSVLLLQLQCTAGRFVLYPLPGFVSTDHLYFSSPAQCFPLIRRHKCVFGLINIIVMLCCALCTGRDVFSSLYLVGPVISLVFVVHVCVLHCTLYNRVVPCVPVVHVVELGGGVGPAIGRHNRCSDCLECPRCYHWLAKRATQRVIIATPGACPAPSPTNWKPEQRKLMENMNKKKQTWDNVEKRKKRKLLNLQNQKA